RNGGRRIHEAHGPGVRLFRFELWITAEEVADLSGDDAGYRTDLPRRHARLDTQGRQFWIADRIAAFTGVCVQVSDAGGQGQADLCQIGRSHRVLEQCAGAQVLDDSPVTAELPAGVGEVTADGR